MTITDGSWSFRRALISLLGLSLISFSGCRKQSTVYFVPIGDAPTSDINALVGHYKQKFGFEAHVLPPMALDETDTDPDRHQLIAENVLESMQQAYPEYSLNKSVILIGITRQDMYPRSEPWDFCFGWRKKEERAAVVSTARLDLRYRGEPIDEATPTKRLQKVVTKDIGILYYDKSGSDNPRSVLYNKILGIQELDEVTEDF
jgi:predicted Zn-dependent protease